MLFLSMQGFAPITIFKHSKYDDICGDTDHFPGPWTLQLHLNNLGQHFKTLFYCCTCIHMTSVHVNADFVCMYELVLESRDSDKQVALVAKQCQEGWLISL